MRLFCQQLNGPLTRYVKLRVAHAPGMPGTFFPVTDIKGNRELAIPTCITARAWRTCRDTCRDRLPAMAGKTFPAFPAHAQTSILRIWQEAHVTIPCAVSSVLLEQVQTNVSIQGAMYDGAVYVSAVYDDVHHVYGGSVYAGAGYHGVGCLKLSRNMDTKQNPMFMYFFTPLFTRSVCTLQASWLEIRVWWDSNCNQFRNVLFLLRRICVFWVG